MRLAELPVFQLCGGERGRRESFLERLVFELDQLHFLTTVVRSDEVQDAFKLYRLTREYDVVFVDGKTDISVQKILLRTVDDDKSEGVLNCNIHDENSLSSFLERFLIRIQEIVDKTPVWASILIGGKSSRMGQPKHLITDRWGKSWLEHVIDILKPLVDGIVISGAGSLPESLNGISRLVDVPGVVGPLAGVLAAVRWQPQVNWLLLACDMPLVSDEAVKWLLNSRRHGCWGCVPCKRETRRLEPLFAWYDARAAILFERQALIGDMRISVAGAHPKIMNPVIPESLQYSWENINTPDQLQQIRSVKSEDKILHTTKS